MPTVLHDIAWRAMQVHGALGVTNEMPFLGMVHGASVMGLADGPTEVHKVTVARQVLRDYQASDDLWPTEHMPEQGRRGARQVRRVPRARSGEPLMTEATGDSTSTGSPRGWTSRACPAKGEPLEADFLSGGTQNEIYEIRRGDLALRPAHPAADRARPTATRASCASGGSSRRSTAPTCRTPRPSPCCEDPSVLGRTFYLMGFVDGWSPMGLRDKRGRRRSTPTSRPGRASAYQLVEGIALLSKVDWQAKGLEDLGRPDGFHERQVDRWTALPRADQGPRAARASTRPRPGCAPTSRSTTSPASCTATTSSPTSCTEHGAPARLAAHRRLGDGHRRRPEARPRLGRAAAGPRTPTARAGDARATST